MMTCECSWCLNGLPHPAEVVRETYITVAVYADGLVYDLRFEHPPDPPVNKNGEMIIPKGPAGDRFRLRNAFMCLAGSVDDLKKRRGKRK